MLSMLPFLRWLLVLAALLCLMLAIDLLLVAPAGAARVFDTRSMMLVGLLGFDTLAVFLLVKHVGHDNSRSSLSSLVALLLATASLHAGVIVWQIVAVDRAQQHTRALRQLERLRKDVDVLETDFGDSSQRSARYLRDAWTELEKSILTTPAASTRWIPQWDELIDDATQAKHAIEDMPAQGGVALATKQRARQAVEALHEQVKQALEGAIDNQQAISLSSRHLCGALCATFALLLAGLHGFSRRVERWLDESSPRRLHGSSDEGDLVPLHAFFEASQHPYLLVDANGSIQGVNAACRTRYPGIELGANLLEAVEPSQRESLQACVRRSQPIATSAVTLRDADQRLRPKWLKFDDYPVLDGEPLLVVAIEERTETPAPVCGLPRRHTPVIALPKRKNMVESPQPTPAPLRHAPFTHGWKADVVGVDGRRAGKTPSQLVCTEPANARFTAGRFIGLPLVASRAPVAHDPSMVVHTGDAALLKPTKPKFQRREAVENRDARVVLVVEDDRNVREMLQSILQHQGHRVLAARDEGEALEFAERNRIDLLVADLVAPQTKSEELLARLRRTQPSLKVLYLTGFLNASFSPSGAECLQKPFSADAFLQKIGTL
jgi:CheY-like chemotaxis protein